MVVNFETYSRLGCNVYPTPKYNGLFDSAMGSAKEGAKDDRRCSSCKGDSVMSVSYCISCDKKLCAHHEQVTLH